MLYATKFSKLSEGLFTFFTSNNPNPTLFKQESYNLIVTDTNSRIVNKFLPITGLKELRFDESGNFTKYDNGVLFSIPFDNSIYFATDKLVVMKYKINFLNYSLPKEIISEYSKSAKNSDSNAAAAFMKLLDIINKDSYALGIHNIFENEKILFFQYNLTLDGTYSVFFNKKSNNIFIGIPENDLDFGLFGKPIALLGDTLVTYIFPYELEKRLKKAELLEEINKTDSFKELKLFSTLLKDSDNPVLIKYCLKDF
jgi:hypothetical protein